MDQLDDYGDDSEARLEGLWKALEKWLASEAFHGSLVTNTATELRARPHHPVHRVINEHRMAMSQLLEDLAKLAGIAYPATFANLSQLIIEGAATSAIIDQRLAHSSSIQTLAAAAVAASSA
jgi:hypothetical protein